LRYELRLATDFGEQHRASQQWTAPARPSESDINSLVELVELIIRLPRDRQEQLLAELQRGELGKAEDRSEGYQQ
jgi:hypothetical protein